MASAAVWLGIDGATGASFTAETVMLTVAVSVAAPSLTV